MRDLLYVRKKYAKICHSANSSTREMQGTRENTIIVEGDYQLLMIMYIVFHHITLRGLSEKPAKGKPSLKELSMKYEKIYHYNFPALYRAVRITPHWTWNSKDSLKIC